MTEAAMPDLLVGRRRWLLAVLAALGAVQAVLAVFTAVRTPQLLDGSPAGGTLALSLQLILAALLVGVARIGERVAAEELGQDYVRETRRLLIASALVPERGINLGTTIARTTNDLSAVKNWVSLGIAPLVVGVPLIGMVVVAMFLVMPTLALVLVGVLAVFGVIMFVLARPLLDRARGLRRVRGRMAGHIADTVTAGEAIRVSGGVDREVARIDKLSAKVVEAARARAAVSGAMRGSAASVTAVLAVLVGVVGSRTGATAADVTTAVLIAGMIAAPVTDLGRVTEYRQNYVAAVRVLRPVLTTARDWKRAERHRRATLQRRRHHTDRPGITQGTVHVADLVDREGPLPELVAAPGSRVVLAGSSGPRLAQVMQALLGDRLSDGWVVVAGRHLDDMPAKVVRELVGSASRDVPLERGTIARVVRYRTPGDEVDAMDLLERVGLADRVRALPDGVRTTLRRGGEPLAPHERGLLKLARAVAGDPPLLLLDRIDDQLDAAGRRVLERVVAEYPGVVVARTANPEAFLTDWEVWNVDELRRTLVVAPPTWQIPARGARATTAHRGGAEPFGPPVHRSAAELAALRGEQERAEPLDTTEDEDE